MEGKNIKIITTFIIIISYDINIILPSNNLQICHNSIAIFRIRFDTICLWTRRSKKLLGKKTTQEKDVIGK